MLVIMLARCSRFVRLNNPNWTSDGRRFAQPLNDFDPVNNRIYRLKHCSKFVSKIRKLFFFSLFHCFLPVKCLITITIVQECSSTLLLPHCSHAVGGWFLEQEAPPWPLLPPLRLVYVPTTSCISLSFLRPASSPANGWIPHDILALAERVHVRWKGNLSWGETLPFNTCRFRAVMAPCRH